MHFRTANENRASGSVSINLPPEVIDKLGIEGGEQLLITLDEDGRLVIRPVDNLDLGV